MFDCNCLIHPFQNDPGTSQRQRVMDELLSEAVKIDSRKMADLLDYFVQLARHINYYDLQLNIGDWQPFFKRSTPFTLAAMIRYPLAEIEDNYCIYTTHFRKKPAVAGLQLISRFIYHHFIERINNWHLVVKDSSLPIATLIEQLVRDKLQQPVKDFITYANAASGEYKIPRFNFHALSENRIWNIDLPDLYSVDTSYTQGTTGQVQQMNALYERFTAIFPALVEHVRSLANEAEKSLDLSLVHTREEFKEKHPPHLGLLFAFLSIFQQLRDDLNQFTRRHLDFFYKEILHFKSGPAIPDQAHVLVELQQQLKKYMLKKGLLLKGGKDDKKQEILFGLDDEILANKTLLSEKRTLFLDNKTTFAQTYVEGVYMAPNASMADGDKKEFEDEDKKYFPTLGARDSKYTDPETNLVKPYPNARLGFILASPVLYLQGGTRKVKIKLSCKLDDSICNMLGDEIIAAGSNCCNDGKPKGKQERPPYPPFYLASKFYDQVNAALAETYYYLSEDILKEAQKKGISKEFIESLRQEFGLLKHDKAICYCPIEKKRFDNFLRQQNPCNPLSPEELDMLEGLVKPVKVLNLQFSGEKKWIEPSSIDIKLVPGSMNTPGLFELDIQATLLPELEPVTFYDKEKLGEDFNTTLPLVKIELDDRIKMEAVLDDLVTPPDADDSCCRQSPGCCVIIPEEKGKSRRVSFYHFFRNVTLENNISSSRIDVEVCGLKKFIVQNQQSPQDVNAPIYAFGVNPKVDSYFLVGSEEIFLKRWTGLWMNVKWKDLPADLTEYYNGYQSEYRLNNIVKKEEVLSKNFLASFSVLRDGKWFDRLGNTQCSIDNINYDPLFPPGSDLAMCFGSQASFDAEYSHQYKFIPGQFQGFPQPAKEKPVYKGLKRWEVDTRCCFLKMTLKCQDFQHEKYSIVLARQLAAEAKLPNLVEGAVYYGLDIGEQFSVIDINKIFKDIEDAFAEAGLVKPDLETLIEKIIEKVDDGSLDLNITVDDAIWQAIFHKNAPTFPLGADENELGDSILYENFMKLFNLLKKNAELIADFKARGVVIPKVPYTPIISNISLDYTATCDINEIDLIHLYPYTGTYHKQEMDLNPSLFARFCDEGTLFLGLKELVPGDNLNILFQLAEATADSESEKEPVNWHYLDSNTWKPLRTGFEVIDDATENLTTSGIVKFALPSNMTRENTVMPKDLYWIKASIAKNSKAVSETIGIHPQAIKVSFVPDPLNDTARLAKALPKNSISKLHQADPAVSGIAQPYEAFGGRVPEGDGHFYTRVSELLRHKGRAIQPWDYERMVLEAFPQLFKAKCISHSFALDAHVYKNDFPYAPGYIVLAVIPDLFKLKAGYSFEPKVPASILEKIETYFRTRTSPFVRLRAMNPRYEKIHFCIRVQLFKGKDENYYKEKLKQDLREYLAPWSVGVFHKLTFGECVYRSDITRFLESTGYVDFVTDLRMWHEPASAGQEISVICPDTARSILVAGDIEVCIEERICEQPGSYTSCDGTTIDRCGNEPRLLADYCKQTRNQIK